MKEHTKELWQQVQWAVAPALLFAIIATSAFTVVTTALMERPLPTTVARGPRMATHVIDYTAADGAPTETYTSASGIANVGAGTKIKLTGTEDGESGTWVIPWDRVEAIDP